MTTTPNEPVREEDIETTGTSATTGLGDADGGDAGDADGGDAEGTDGGDADGADGGDADGADA
jgi:hypothetical protein